jgi:hypothetical protein
MKKLIVLIFLMISWISKAQQLPTIPSSGFAFSIGTKFTIKLVPTDSAYFDFSVISFESYRKTVDSWENDDLFEKVGQDSTITCYFCYGTHGETKEEKEKNMKVLLIMKNYSKFVLEYKSDIQRNEDGEFLPTSNDGLFPNVKSTEIWPYMIFSIGLRDFRIRNL